MKYDRARRREKQQEQREARVAVTFIDPSLVHSIAIVMLVAAAADVILQ